MHMYGMLVYKDTVSAIDLASEALREMTSFDVIAPLKPPASDLSSCSEEAEEEGEDGMESHNLSYGYDLFAFRKRWRRRAHMNYERYFQWQY